MLNLFQHLIRSGRFSTKLAFRPCKFGMTTFLFIIIILLNSCTDKFDVGVFDDIKGNPNLGGDTVYVQLTPAWRGFNNPQDIYIGREPFIYIADTDNDRIVMMNIDGRILGTKNIPKPVAVAQDYELNLIVCGRFDTTISGQTKSDCRVGWKNQ